MTDPNFNSHNPDAVQFSDPEATPAGAETAAWQHAEILNGIRDLDSGHTICHEKVADWLSLWGKENAPEAPTRL